MSANHVDGAVDCVTFPDAPEVDPNTLAVECDRRTLTIEHDVPPARPSPSVRQRYFVRHAPGPFHKTPGLGKGPSRHVVGTLGFPAECNRNLQQPEKSPLDLDRAQVGCRMQERGKPSRLEGEDNMDFSLPEAKSLVGRAVTVRPERREEVDFDGLFRFSEQGKIIGISGQDTSQGIPEIAVVIQFWFAEEEAIPELVIMKNTTIMSTTSMSETRLISGSSTRRARRFIDAMPPPHPQA